MPDSKQKISLLPDNVVNMIAAGEVVERPASVVKEIMENSVDAEATRIDVTVAGGGVRLISVKDNGSGMNPDDALLCLERHATSKIKNVEDISRINTMGFRGEALAAIASVSRLRLTTCERGAAVGTEITMTGGKLGEVKEAGMPAGTCVEVRDLFFNTPARRKFLRSHQTEINHIKTAFLLQAMAHPEISMSLKIDGEAVYELPAGSIEDRLRDIFGGEYLKNFCHTDYEEKGIKVAGYVSVPSFHRSDRQEEYFFVNKRPVSAPVLFNAIKEAYRTLIPHDKYPLFFLFIEIDSAQVDVNIHPTKREVKFRKANDVHDVVAAAVRKGLGISETKGKDVFPIPAQPISTFSAGIQQKLEISDMPVAPAFQYPRINLNAATAVPSQKSYDNGKDNQHDKEKREREEYTGQSPWVWCRVLGQIGGLYVVLETSDGLVLMDPHAAHERVMFERFMSEVEKKDVKVQGLLIPETIEMPPADVGKIRKYISVLRNMGFGISEFGNNSFVIDSIPSCLGKVNIIELLREMALEIEAAGGKAIRKGWSEEIVAQAACKAAVKAKNILSLEEIEQLVKDLAVAKMPFSCPHGRPTMILTSFRELNRKFGRE